MAIFQQALKTLTISLHQNDQQDKLIWPDITEHVQNFQHYSLTTHFQKFGMNSKHTTAILQIKINLNEISKKIFFKNIKITLCAKILDVNNVFPQSSYCQYLYIYIYYAIKYVALANFCSLHSFFHKYMEI